jgi:XTP/dITP diphosphohydrolase
MTNLYIATTNPGKLRDFAHAAAGEFEIEPLPDIDRIAAPAEDSDTFEGNARIKALAYSALAPGEIVLADDSGIELDALGGAPGVRSARYAEDEGFAGEGLSQDQRNLACLLDRTRHLTGEDRYARYRCVLVAARDGEVIATGTGDVEGILLDKPQGTGGFGYDPVFLISEHDETMAELDPATRLSLSHRGRALRDLLTKIAQLDR